MYSEVAYNSSPLATLGLGHVLQQGNPLSQATVNPADLFWTQPSHGPTQAYTIPHNVPSTANNNFGGYLPGVDHAPQGASGYHPLAEVTQCIGHPLALGQFTVTNEGPPMIVGPVPSGRSVMCEWVSEDGPMPVCCQTITRRTLSMHLAEHGIRNMPRNHIVQCRWQGCGAQMKRQGITRHVREVHMGLKRKSHKHAFPRQSLSSMP